MLVSSTDDSNGVHIISQLKSDYFDYVDFFGAKSEVSETKSWSICCDYDAIRKVFHAVLDDDAELHINVSEKDDGVYLNLTFYMAGQSLSEPILYKSLRVERSEPIVMDSSWPLLLYDAERLCHLSFSSKFLKDLLSGGRDKVQLSIRNECLMLNAGEKDSVKTRDYTYSVMSRNAESENLNINLPFFNSNYAMEFLKDAEKVDLHVTRQLIAIVFTMKETVVVLHFHCCQSCAEGGTEISHIKRWIDLLIEDYLYDDKFNQPDPLLSLSVLQNLSSSARIHPCVRKILVESQLAQGPLRDFEHLKMERGRGIIGDNVDIERLQVPFVSLLLRLLNQPLYLRSRAYVEQVLSLLEIMIGYAECKPHTDVVSTAVDSETNIDDVGPTKPYDYMKNLLLTLSRADLRPLCSLLATEGLSENVYRLVGEMLKKLVTLYPPFCQLIISELAMSVEELVHSVVEELHASGNSELALHRSSSSDETMIRRVLQAGSSLVSIKSMKGDESIFVKDPESPLSLVSPLTSVLEPLWRELTTCLSRIEDSSKHSGELPSSATPPLPRGALIVLPYIKLMFFTFDEIQLGYSCTSEDEASTSYNQQISGFVEFIEKHRQILNQFIRCQEICLAQKPFSLMLRFPDCIAFDNKHAHFKSKLERRHSSRLTVSVRRRHIFADSYEQLHTKSTQEWKGKLVVDFRGEEGLDAGGLTREWYQSMSRVMFDKDALLFTPVGNDSSLQPTPNSGFDTEHLSYFKFVGRVVGKALLDGELLDVHFTRSFYKHIIGVKVTYHDIEAIDPVYYRNLIWMLENEGSDLLGLTFSIDADEEKQILYGREKVTDYELIPGGHNIKVNDRNKHHFVDLVAEHKLAAEIRPQINAFLEGFNELIPLELVSIFNDKELELLISGLPEIDLDDMRANTEYSGYSPSSPVIQWFWEVVQEFNKEDKAHLLQFVTGVSKVPLGGFGALKGISGAQKFNIHKAYDAGRLPSAHTCSNQLDLPQYPSKEHLREKLTLAIHEGYEGFAFI